MCKSIGLRYSNWQLSRNNQYVSYALLSWVGRITDVTNSKRHQRMSEILIIFTCTIQEISKVVCKKTVSKTRAFITSLCCVKRAHYSKRMLRIQDCVKFRRRMMKVFLKTTSLISAMQCG